MNDAMKMSDGVAMSLECGHPNKNEGEFCENCGHIVRRAQPAKESEDEQSSVRPEDGGPGQH